MAKCSKSRGLLVYRPCEVPAFGTCAVCNCEVCAEHATILNKQIFCLSCFVNKQSVPLSNAIEDWGNGEIENFGVWMERARKRVQGQFNPLSLASIYNFNAFDFQAFEKEYLSYYDIGETKTNVYDS